MRFELRSVDEMRIGMGRVRRATRQATLLATLVVFTLLHRAAQASKAGGLIAFIVSRQDIGYTSGAGNLYVVNTDGSSLKRIVTGGNCTYAVWMPDGKRILAAQRDRLVSVKANGTGMRTIVSMRGWTCYTPSVSRETERLVFAASRSEDQLERLIVAGFNGRAPRVLLSQESQPGTAFASPFFVDGGRRIVFNEHGSEAGYASLHSVEVSSGKRRQLYGYGKDAKYYDCYHPALSTDGRWLACYSESWPGGISETTRGRGIVVMTSGGGNAKLVMNTTERLNGLCWSPDGKEIVFGSDEGLKILNLRTRKVRWLVRRGFASSPSWQPVGAPKAKSR